jgi:SAM-dependent methyltransferase
MHQVSLAINELRPRDKTKIPISARTFNERFGSKGDFYFKAKLRLGDLFSRAQFDPIAKSTLDGWSEDFEKIYGSHAEVKLFIDHVYLILLAKILIYYQLCSEEIIEFEIRQIISGHFFKKKGIKNFHDGFTNWLLIPEIQNEAVHLICELSSELAAYDFSQLTEDLFSMLYQEMVERQERHKAGEYYTPNWLVELILNEALSNWEQQNNGKIPKILDPACGSGSFIFHAIKIFREKQFSLKEILANIQGIDIHPIAGFIARANYILAIGDLIDADSEIEIPIFIKDSLKSADLFEDGMKLENNDILVGNPPWVVMRSLRNKGYQQFLKREVLNYGLLQKGDVHLFTQMELATILFCKSADLYLMNGGIIAFVMPRSVLAGTKHHINFRKFRTPPIRLLKIIDLEEVNPLFNAPACVLIGLKGAATHYPVPIEMYRGKLNDPENISSKMSKLLSVRVSEYTPPNFSVKHSYYYDKFRVGASIFPRSLYFVDIVSVVSGSNRIRVTTSDDIFQIVRHPWQVSLNGEIDQKYLFATLLAWEIFPFGFLKLRPVVLPIRENSACYEIINIGEVEESGDRNSAQWFLQAQTIWNENRTKNSAQRFPKLSDRLNYNGLLTIQNIQKRYIVMYNATGTNLVSCVIDRANLPSFEANKETVIPQGFVLDVKTWFLETTNELEAYYLASLLNSDTINKLIKPLQPKGLFGARAIHRRPFLLTIPKFDEKDDDHIKIAEIGLKCEHQLKAIEFIQSNRMRAEARRLLKNEIAEIDCMVSTILKNRPAEE